MRDNLRHQVNYNKEKIIKKKRRRMTKTMMMKSQKRNLRKRRKYRKSKDKRVILQSSNKIVDGQLSKRKKLSLQLRSNRVLHFKRN